MGLRWLLMSSRSCTVQPILAAIFIGVSESTFVLYWSASPIRPSAPFDSYILCPTKCRLTVPAAEMLFEQDRAQAVESRKCDHLTVHQLVLGRAPDGAQRAFELHRFPLPDVPLERLVTGAAWGGLARLSHRGLRLLDTLRRLLLAPLRFLGGLGGG